MSILIAKSVVPIRCHRCKHEWNYSGKNTYVVTCPHCRTYVRVKKNMIADVTGESLIGTQNSQVTGKQRTTETQIGESNG